MRSRIGGSQRALTLPGAGHGGFSDEQELKAFETVRAFLVSVGAMAGPK
jgi:hypothetical protein